MKLRTLSGIAATYTALAAVGFIFAPRAVGIAAVPPDPPSALLTYLRLFGSPFPGSAVLDWKPRTADAAPSPP